MVWTFIPKKTLCELQTEAVINFMTSSDNTWPPMLRKTSEAFVFQPPLQAFFEAVSSDYCFRKGKGRTYKAGSYGRIANLDEVYPSFLSFGLIDGDSKAKGSVNAHTSLLNRFLQTGGSSKITRTAGAYGGAGADTVSFSMIGNCHPTMALSMLEGETGSTVAAPHDRILFFTAPRVLPHEEVSESVEVSGDRFVWSEFPAELAELAKIPVDILTDPERAAVAGRPRLTIYFCFLNM